MFFQTKHLKFKAIFLFLATLLVINPVEAQTKRIIKVGTAGSPPFIFNEDEGQNYPIGISVDIFREAWEGLPEEKTENLKYKLIPQPSVKAGIDSIVKGDIDILIGPISITDDRLRKVQFTQPYYTAEVGLLLNKNQVTYWSIIINLFRQVFISSVGILLILLFVVGNLLWLAERNYNSEQFPKAYFPGVASGMWFALVTLTTVGYGDKSPVTRNGKLLASVWMLVSMVTVSSLTAGLTTTSTIALFDQNKRILFKTPGELFNQKIAVVKETSGEKWGQLYKTDLVLTDNLAEAIENLENKSVKGVIFDLPALKYYLKQNPKSNLTLSPFILARENYGFVLSFTNDIVNDINVIILEMDEKGRIEQIVKEWLE